ncbi:MAG: PAS-domain containing protein [Chloroflexi bacterium]|nr:PAS-domain containing protein [Chloroflexota bacterium]
MRTRLTLVMVALLAAVQLVVVMSYLGIARERRAAEISNTVAVGQNIAAVVDGFVRDLEHMMLAASAGLGGRGDVSDPASLRPYLSGLFTQYGELRSLFLTDLGGQVVASYSGEVGFDLANRPYIQALRNGAEKVWSSGLAGSQTGQLTTVFARTVTTLDGRPTGYLVAAFYPEQMLRGLPVSLPPDARVRLIDEEGDLLYASDEGAVLPGLSVWPEMATALAGIPVRLDGEARGVPGEARFGVLAPVGRVGWVVALTRPLEGLEAEMRAQFLAQSASIAVVMLLAAALAALSAHHMARPLATLAEAARAIGRGERMSVPGTADAETSALAAAMQTMSMAVKDREEALSFQKMLLEAQSEASDEGILVVARDAVRIISSNRRLAEMWDVPEKVVRAGSSNVTLLAEVAPRVADPDGFLARVAQLYEQPDEVAHDEIALKDGRSFERHTEPVKGADGAYHGRVWYFRDITRRKRAEERTRFLAEASPVLTTSLDYDKTLAAVADLIVASPLADWCVIDVREEGGSLHRVAVAHQDPEKVALANSLQEQYPPDSKQDRGVFRVVRTGHSELYAEIPDSLLVEAARDPEHLAILRGLGITSAMAVPLGAGAPALGVLTLVTAESGRRYDGDDLRLAEEIGRRAGMAIENARLYKELERANEAKDEFLGLISHELRTPITAIYGGARLLETRFARLDEEARKATIEDIEHEAERLYRLVEDLLVLARLELGQKLSPEPVQAERVIDKAVSSFRQRRPGRQIELKIAGSLPPVAAEDTYLQQVMYNLLSNADKYSPPDSPIEVHAWEDGDGDVTTVVLDRGPGIAAEEADLLFDRFYRSDRTSKGAKGLGIGLTVCKRLVEAQSGRVWAKPREGGGAEVGFALPVYGTEATDGY